MAEVVAADAVDVVGAGVAAVVGAGGAEVVAAGVADVLVGTGVDEVVGAGVADGAETDADAATGVVETGEPPTGWATGPGATDGCGLAVTDGFAAGAVDGCAETTGPPRRLCRPG